MNVIKKLTKNDMTCTEEFTDESIQFRTKPEAKKYIKSFGYSLSDIEIHSIDEKLIEVYAGNKYIGCEYFDPKDKKAIREYASQFMYDAFGTKLSVEKSKFTGNYIAQFYC